MAMAVLEAYRACDRAGVLRAKSHVGTKKRTDHLANAHGQSAGLSTPRASRLWGEALIGRVKVCQRASCILFVVQHSIHVFSDSTSKNATDDDLHTHRVQRGSHVEKTFAKSLEIKLVQRCFE